MFNHEVHEGHEVKNNNPELRSFCFVNFVAPKALVVRKVSA